MKLNRTLCSLNKDEIDDNLTDIITIISKAKHICRKCARGSGKAKYLCKPVKIQSKKKRD